MSNRGLEPLEALDQFPSEAQSAGVKVGAGDCHIGPTRGVAAFLGWVLAMCVHPIAAWRRLSRTGRSLVLAVYGMVGYLLGTMLLLAFN